MNWKKQITFAVLVGFVTALPVLAGAQSSQSESSQPKSTQPKSNQPRRIEVYPLSQQYWDTKSGETLGEIVQQLLPYNNSLQQLLMQDIIKLNPHAFRDNNPNRMQANTRLWLPNNLTRADNRVDQNDFSVQAFSWGNIKRPRR